MRVRRGLWTPRLFARAAQPHAAHHFRRRAGLHHRDGPLGAARPCCLLGARSGHECPLQVRYVLIKRRMAWIERERKRRSQKRMAFIFAASFLFDLLYSVDEDPCFCRMRQRGDADGGGGSKRVRNAAQLRTTTSEPKKKGAQNV